MTTYGGRRVATHYAFDDTLQTTRRPWAPAARKPAVSRRSAGGNPGPPGCPCQQQAEPSSGRSKW